jgi:hypothetical protein
MGKFAECFDPKKTAAWRRRLRRLTRGLGAARDLDVQIAFVQRVLAAWMRKTTGAVRASSVFCCGCGRTATPCSPRSSKCWTR